MLLKKWGKALMLVLIICAFMLSACEQSTTTDDTTNVAGEATESTDETTDTPVEEGKPLTEGAALKTLVGPSESGMLKLMEVEGTMQICNEAGEPVQLRGMSTHGLQWFPQIINNNAFAALKNDWGSNVIRLAFYVNEGGYIEDPSVKDLLIEGIELAIANDMYAIVDWHIHAPGDPTDPVYSGALEFFDEISDLYPNNEHIIYELANEPNPNEPGVSNDSAGWEKVKTFCDPIVQMLRDKGNENLIIVGSPNWSQRPDLAIDNPIEDDNTCYSFHFYAGTHPNYVDMDDPGNIMGNVQKALDNGLAVFASEWGTSKSDGTGGVFFDKADDWIEFMNTRNISWINWSLTNKDETSAAFYPYVMGLVDATELDPGEDQLWTVNELSFSGEYIRTKIKDIPYERQERVFPSVEDDSAPIGVPTFPCDFEDDTRQGWTWAGESGIKVEMLIDEVDGSKAMTYIIEYTEEKPADNWENGARMVLRDINILVGTNTAFSYDLYLEPERATTGRMVAYLAFAPPSMGYWAQPLYPTPIELSDLSTYEEVEEGIYKVHCSFDLTELKGFKMFREDTELRDITIVLADEESDYMGRVYLDNIQFGE